MKVILLRDIPKLGKKDDIKEVSDGYAQNALLPKKLVKIATQQELASLKARLEANKKAEQEHLNNIKKDIETLKNKKIIVKLASNDQGHLFSKFKVEQLKKVLKEKNIEVDTKIIVPFEIKEVGVHTIKIKSPEIVGDFEIEIKGL